MKYPLVSILIPCYNAEPFLEECLETVFAQTYPEMEILAYDDGSTDNTWEILQKYSKRIKIHRSLVNSGQAKASNFLLYKTNAEFIHCQDVDDLMHPRFIELMLPWLLTDEYEIVLCNVDFFLNDDPGNLKGGWYVRPRFQGEEWLAYIIQVGGSNINSLYKREALFKVGGFRETVKIAVDYDLHLRLAEAGFHFAALEQSLVKGRQKQTHYFKSMDNLLAEVFDVLADLHSRLETQGKVISDDVRTALAEKCWHMGRQLTEAGRHSKAQEAFRLSKIANRYFKIPGSLAYQLLVKIFGLSFIERVRYLKHKMKRCVSGES